MSEIKLEDNGFDVLQKMAKGNPGALSVCMQILKEGKNIDPQNTMGGLGTILFLDTLGIYGAQIWMLFKDVCNESLLNMIAVIRATQLGLVSKNKVTHAIDNYGEGVDVDKLLEQVKSQLINFGKGAAQ